MLVLGVGVGVGLTWADEAGSGADTRLQDGLSNSAESGSIVAIVCYGSAMVGNRNVGSSRQWQVRSSGE